jgi:hypothetical protein
MDDDVINVTCLVFPDGSTYWYPTDDYRADRLIDKWKATLSVEQRRAYHDKGCLGGVVRLRMLRKDYQSIPATSQSEALFAS